MSQKVESSPRQPLPVAETQRVNGPHFELNSDTTDARFDHPPYSGTPLNQRQCDRTRLLQNGQEQTDELERNPSNVLVTVLMPCLNEARTLAACIQQAHSGCQAALSTRNISGHAGSTFRQCDDEHSATVPAPAFTCEILIADNGSTDGSPEIAEANVARVVHVEQKGYGAALRGGIAAARGEYIVMGDSDCSYDFGEVRRFLDKLEEGYGLVMGNRFAGGIMPGAMPWHHRYIGNPVLSGLGRVLYRTHIRDWHCGLRAFDRRSIPGLQLESDGMELASEMVLRASQEKLRVAEIPMTLYPDGRSRPPHLRSCRDGLRHLWLMVALSISR